MTRRQHCIEHDIRAGHDEDDCIYIVVWKAGVKVRFWERSHHGVELFRVAGHYGVRPGSKTSLEGKAPRSVYFPDGGW